MGIYLNVPYDEKDEAKALGAKWDVRVKKWYTDTAGEEMHLAWVDSEEAIPPQLLRYLKTNYSVKMGYSKTAGKCFANHCDCCGAIQGNWFLFNEPDSPLSSCINEDKLIQRMEKLKVFLLTMT